MERNASALFFINFEVACIDLYARTKARKRNFKHDKGLLCLHWN